MVHFLIDNYVKMVTYFDMMEVNEFRRLIRGYSSIKSVGIDSFVIMKGSSNVGRLG